MLCSWGIGFGKVRTKGGDKEYLIRQGRGEKGSTWGVFRLVRSGRGCLVCLWGVIGWMVGWGKGRGAYGD